MMIDDDYGDGDDSGDDSDDTDGVSAEQPSTCVANHTMSGGVGGGRGASVGSVRSGRSGRVGQVGSGLVKSGTGDLTQISEDMRAHHNKL